MAIPYWRLKDRYHRLLGSVCKVCKKEYFPPVYICSNCGSEKIIDKEMPVTGKIITYTILREPLPGFEDQEPMILGIIKLDNDVKVVGQIVDANIDQISIDDCVKTVFRKIKVEGECGPIYYGYKFIKI